MRGFGAAANKTGEVSKLCKRLAKKRKYLSFCYESGPFGYKLCHQIRSLGAECAVVAPSLIPKKAGDRVMTDRQDAGKLAKLHRADELTPVWGPDASHEAMRELVRARGAAQQAQRWPVYNCRVFRSVTIGTTLAGQLGRRHSDVGLPISGSIPRLSR